MGNIEVKLNTENAIVARREADSELKHLDILLEEFSESTDISNESRTCFVIGYGSQTKSTYAEIISMTGVFVLWTSYMLSGIFQILELFMAGRMGVIEVKDKTKISEIMRMLSHRGMVGLYSFKREYKEEVLAVIKAHRLRVLPESILQKDSSYLGFLIDGDNPNSTTGIKTSIYYGKDCPRDLIRIAEKI